MCADIWYAHLKFGKSIFQNEFLLLSPLAATTNDSPEQCTGENKKCKYKICFRNNNFVLALWCASSTACINIVCWISNSGEELYSLRFIASEVNRRRKKYLKRSLREKTKAKKSNANKQINKNVKWNHS